MTKQRMGKLEKSLVAPPERLQEKPKRNHNGTWLSGETGNPNGRPVGRVSLVERLRRYLQRHPEEADAIIAQLIKQGKIGNMVATKELMDRIDGKVAETHRIEGELPVTLIFRRAEELLPVETTLTIEGERVEQKMDGL